MGPRPAISSLKKESWKPQRRLKVDRPAGANPLVRLFTRRGFDWSDRYPAIVGAAERLRSKSFTIDGEAVVCGPDGIAVFDALQRGVHCDNFAPSVERPAQWANSRLTYRCIRASSIVVTRCIEVRV